MYLQCALLILGSVLLAGVVNPWVFLPIVPLLVVFIYIRRYYLQTSRDIKRLEATSKSSVYHRQTTGVVPVGFSMFGIQCSDLEHGRKHNKNNEECYSSN